MNRDEIFGEVRSLLGRREHDVAWTKQLLDLATKAKREDPEFHGEQLVPYLEGQRVDWPEPLLEVHLNDLEDAREALPMATFELDLRDVLLIGEPEPDYLPYFDDEPLKVRKNNRVLANVSKLRLDSRLALQPAIHALLHSPDAAALRDFTIMNHDTHPRSIQHLSEETLGSICDAPSAPDWRHLTIRQSSLFSGLSERLFSNFPGESLRTLDLSNNYVRQASPASTPWLGQLETLVLRACGIQPEGLEGLLSKTTFANMKKLALSDNFASGQGIDALKGEGRFPALRELELGGCKLGPTEIDTLLSLDLPSLERLSIDRNELDADTLARFITSPFTRHFKGFELSFTNANARAFEPLLAHPNLDIFETLTIALASPARMTPPMHAPRYPPPSSPPKQEDLELIKDIVTSIAPEQMRTLVLTGLPIAEATALHIAKMKNLEHLDLSNARITPETIRALFSKSFPNLTFANFSSIDIDDALIEAFLDGAVMGKLDSLILSRNRISNRGAELLAAVDKTPMLRTLSLTHNNIGDDGCVAFIESEPFRRTVKSFDILTNPFENQTGTRMERELRPHMDVTCFMYIG